MTTYYVNLSGATGTGDGSSEANEAATFAELSLSASDTVSFAKGSSSRGIVISSSLTGLTLTSHGSGDRPWIRGDIPIASGNWTDEADNTFSATLSAEPDSVLYNIATNIDSDGRHYGHLVKAASLAACQSTDATWFWASNVLYVNPSAAMTDPDTGGDYSYSEIEKNGVTLTGSGARCIGLRASFWTDTSANFGYGLRFEGGNNYSEGNRVDDCGYHGIGHVTGAPQTGTSFNDEIWGFSETMFVFHSNTGDVDGASTSGLHLHVYSRLGVDGTALATQSFIAYFAHATGDVLDIENTDTTWTCYGEAQCNLLAADDCPTVSAADRYEYTNYAIRFTGASIINGPYITLGAGGAATASAAFRRSSLSMDDAINLPDPSNQFAIGCMDQGQLLLDACVSYAEINGAATDMLYYVRGSANSRITTINTLSVVDGTLTGAGDGFFHSNGWGNSGGIENFGSVFAWLGTGSMALIRAHGPSKFAAADHVFESCWYYGISTYGRTVTALDTLAEWTAGIDADGVYAIDPDISLVDGVYSPDSPGDLRDTVTPEGEEPTYTAAAGINGLGYDGRYGPYQYTPSTSGTLGKQLIPGLGLGIFK